LKKDALLVEGFPSRLPFWARAFENARPFVSKGFRKSLLSCSRAFQKACPFGQGLSYGVALLVKGFLTCSPFCVQGLLEKYALLVRGF
jgi:hypothetical protein